jgi:hypothetical protein
MLFNGLLYSLMTVYRHGYEYYHRRSWLTWNQIIVRCQHPQSRSTALRQDHFPPLQHQLRRHFHHQNQQAIHLLLIHLVVLHLFSQYLEARQDHRLFLPIQPHRSRRPYLESHKHHRNSIFRLHTPRSSGFPSLLT